jgi:hypothetical protein
MMEPREMYVVLKADTPFQTTLNTTALLTMLLAKLGPDLVGPSVSNSDGTQYPGITRVPVIIMKATNAAELKATFRDLSKEGLSPVLF